MKKTIQYKEKKKKRTKKLGQGHESVIIDK